MASPDKSDGKKSPRRFLSEMLRKNFEAQGIHNDELLTALTDHLPTNSRKHLFLDRFSGLRSQPQGVRN